MGTYLIDILKRGDRGGLSYNNDKEKLKEFEARIKAKLSESSNARWDLAICIAELARSGCWMAFFENTCLLSKLWESAHPAAKYAENPYHFSGGDAYCCHSLSFFTFLKECFGLGRTTVYSYLEVVDEFATYVQEKGKAPEYKIGEEAKHFQFWQLVEMTSLTYQERLKVQPNWTREEIRAYKKSLREKKDGKIQPAEQVIPEEKPLSEAQQRFAKYSKDDLIDLVLELEQACSDNKREVERILAAPPSIEDVLPLKQELSAVIEKQLKAYPYEIHLHGRKQGVKAFSGVLARVILESCASSNIVSGDSAGDLIQEKFAV